MNANNLDLSILKQRESDSFYNATDLLSIYNNNNHSKKKFQDFFENQSTHQIQKNLMLKLGLTKVNDSQRGKYGGTWMHEELLIVFHNWLYKLPNQTITRDELVFVQYIKESFNGILEFETQKKFGTYYVDLYCKELSLCIEFDEMHHNRNKNIILDSQRQKEIEETHNVNFIRHNSNENYSVCINKIIIYKESFNLVNAIKNGQIPKKGFL